MQRSMWSWGIILSLGIGGVTGLGSPGFGQVPDVPPPPPGAIQAGPPPAANDINGLARAMGRDLRKLKELMAGDLTADAYRVLGQDVQELIQALDEFAQASANPADVFSLRQSFSNIDQSWHYLRSRFTVPEAQSPAINFTLPKIDADDQQIHQALNLNPVPATYYAPGTTAPTGIAETQRLARALEERAAALAAVMRTDMPGPAGIRPIQLATNLTLAADAFHDGIDLNAAPLVARNGFAGVDAMTDDLRRLLMNSELPPRVQAAWQAYLAAEVLTKQSLGMVNTEADLYGTTVIPQAGAPSPVVALSNQLVEQAGAFVQVFTQTSPNVPEGGLFLADAQRLQAAAADFSRDAARGLNINQLAYEFRDVDALWQVLARRTNRIARGRVGPNIDQVGKMGQTVAEIHRVLGMPGYPAGLVAVPVTSPR